MKDTNLRIYDFIQEVYPPPCLNTTLVLHTEKRKMMHLSLSLPSAAHEGVDRSRRDDFLNDGFLNRLGGGFLVSGTGSALGGCTGDPLTTKMSHSPRRPKMRTGHQPRDRKPGGTHLTAHLSTNRPSPESCVVISSQRAEPQVATLVANWGWQPRLVQGRSGDWWEGGGDLTGWKMTLFGVEF